MRLPDGNSSILTSSAEVWDFFCRNAGLDTEFYDSPIEQDLREALGLSVAGDLRSLLIDRAVSIEDFVSAFFQAAEPFAQMMSDLLRFFEHAAAREGRANLAMEFDFGIDLPQLDFDLNNFRKWLERWQRVRSILTVNLWDVELLWSLVSALAQQPQASNRQINNGIAVRWLKEYEQGFWPDAYPKAPTSGDPELDVRFLRLWRLWTTVVRESAGHGATHEDLRRAAQELDRPRGEVDRLREAELREGAEERLSFLDSWPASLLNNLNGEFWPRQILASAYLQAESVAGGQGSSRTQNAQQLANRLDEIFGQVDSREVHGTQLLQHLDDFLNLPIWKYRHELFSAWVSTQIIDSLDSETIRVHQYGGVLEFAFSGTHIATLDSVTPRLHLWAEMRSPLASPVGKGRKAAIQPDYSLIADPVTTPLASILEVECKQYRRPSARNFSAALTDYARGRPNASIILVNYGPASDRIIALVAPDVRDRTHIIGDFRPGNDSQIRQFRKIVTEALSGWKRNCHSVTRRGSFSRPLPNRIVLRWDSDPSDLDLHLIITTASETIHINYNNMGSLEQSPWLKLLRDVTTGLGPEEITIARWIPARYACYVHKFQGNRTLVQSDARVRVVYDGRKSRLIRCPRDGIGDWWHVFTLDVSGSLDVGEGILKDPRAADLTRHLTSR